MPTEIVLIDFLFRQADAGELPSRVRREEVPVGRPDMSDRCRARSATQHKLITHELAIVPHPVVRAEADNPDTVNMGSASTPRHRHKATPARLRQLRRQRGGAGRSPQNYRSPARRLPQPPTPPR